MIRRYPTTFYILCACQFWWAVSFYSLWTVLPVFLHDALHLDEKSAFSIFGSFTAIGASLLFVGGWLADKVLGAKRTLWWGYAFQGVGYALITYASLSEVTLWLFAGLGCVIVGRSIGGVAAPALVAAAYNQGDQRLDSAFTLFYMVNNIGAFLTTIAAAEVAARLGWQAAFILSTAGMVINLLLLARYKRYLVNASPVDSRKPGGRIMAAYLGSALLVVGMSMFLLRELLITRLLLLTVALIILLLIVRILRREPQISRLKMVVGVVLMGQALVFFILYNQMPTSLNFFAINNVRPSLLGIVINPVSFQALNPMWVIVLSPGLAWLYTWLGERGRDPSMPVKFAVGMLACAAAFACAGSARFFANDQGIVSPFWIIAPHLLFAIGELLISALGQSMLAKLFPREVRGFIYGAWGMVLALASLGAAWLAGFSASDSDAGRDALHSLQQYASYFYALALATVIVALICWWLAPRLDRLINTPASPTA
ncbi:peptide transporter [Edwardsiella hoshinae]|uniref:Peptide transporter n=1 Tax=Edwardsiella hoshinae TaxID=93378 RepID=A0ABN4SWP1_9GAMM|nr:oligopeptide:H+ symporter [Edwardsiella hoshinae]AOV97194.1 peptide transporter [Edwardsiella hoshinae]